MMHQRNEKHKDEEYHTHRDGDVYDEVRRRGYELGRRNRKEMEGNRHDGAAEDEMVEVS